MAADTMKGNQNNPLINKPRFWFTTKSETTTLTACKYFFVRGRSGWDIYKVLRSRLRQDFQYGGLTGTGQCLCDSLEEVLYSEAFFENEYCGLNSHLKKHG